MAQVKIYALADTLANRRIAFSETIHACVMEVLQMPADKRAHRFFPLAAEDFIMPGGRSAQYTIVEIQLISGRQIETKKRLIRRLFERFASDLAIDPVDLEIVIFESPPENWGFRGFHGDEVKLNYTITV